jgi:hypothetical protein
MKKDVFSIAIAIVVSVVIFSFCSKSTETILQKTADEVNKQCPIRIDPTTVLDSVAVPTSTTFQYYYTVLFAPGQQMDKAQYAQLMETMKPVVTNQVKANQQLEALKKMKVTFGYTYYDGSGDLIGKVSVTPDMYQ